jgi:hypothetical protein
MIFIPRSSSSSTDSDKESAEVTNPRSRSSTTDSSSFETPPGCLSGTPIDDPPRSTSAYSNTMAKAAEVTDPPRSRLNPTLPAVVVQKNLITELCKEETCKKYYEDLYEQKELEQKARLLEKEAELIQKEAEIKSCKEKFSSDNYYVTALVASIFSSVTLFFWTSNALKSPLFINPEDFPERNELKQNIYQIQYASVTIFILSLLSLLLRDPNNKSNLSYGLTVLFDLIQIGLYGFIWYKLIIAIPSLKSEKGSSFEIPVYIYVILGISTLYMMFNLATFIALTRGLSTAVSGIIYIIWRILYWTVIAACLALFIIFVLFVIGVVQSSYGNINYDD